MCAWPIRRGEARARPPRRDAQPSLARHAGEVRRGIVATARSQAVLGLTFFAVSHAMLGAAFYLSETRYARESEDLRRAPSGPRFRTTTWRRSTRRPAGRRPECARHDRRCRAPGRAGAGDGRVVLLGADAASVLYRYDGGTSPIRAARNAELVCIRRPCMPMTSMPGMRRRHGVQRSDPERRRRGRRVAARRRGRRSRSAGRAPAGGRRDPATIAATRRRRG